MSTADSKSHLVVDLGDWIPPGIPAGNSPSVPPSVSKSHQTGPIFLDGDVLSCACPQCGSPMSIRLWLMLADCWHCGLSVELTEEQEREAQRLLELRRRQTAPPPPEAGPWANPVPRPPQRPMAPAPPAAVSSPPAARPIAPAPPAPHPASAPPPVGSLRPAGRQPSPARGDGPSIAAPTPPRAPAAPPTAARLPQSKIENPKSKMPPTPAAVAAQRVKARLRTEESEGLARVWARGLFQSLPAWLASLILHMVALILLGLWMNPVQDEDRYLVLATQVGPEDAEGGIDDIARSDDPQSFQDPGDLTPRDSEASEALKRDGVAEMETFNTLPMLSEAGDMPRMELPVAIVPVLAAQGVGTIYLGRDPQARVELVRSSGGTIASEAAVARGLEWLSWHQHSDGSWSLDLFHRAGKCDGRCGNPGSQCNTAATALALLPFLGAGQTHQQGKYTDQVRRGLEWLVKNQKSDGDLWTGGVGNSQMYAHGQAAIALCEAYALTKDSLLKGPAQKSLDFIVAAQHSAGGWRYTPGMEGDTSVVGWQLMALRSGQLGGLEVPDAAFESAGKFLNAVQVDSTGGSYSYQPGHGASPTMSAEALLCRQYSGWLRNHPGLSVGVRDLNERYAPKAGPSNMYYWYYATQVMHHMGGQPWKDWNPKMRDLLVNTQETKGHQAGSWAPTGNFDPAGGRLYMTALAVCTLEVYYRHMPLYQEAALEAE